MRRESKCLLLPRQVGQSAMIVMPIAFDVFEAERGNETEIRLRRHDSHRAKVFAGHDVVVSLATVIVPPGKPRIQQTLHGSLTTLAADAAISKLNRLAIRIERPV